MRQEHIENQKLAARTASLLLMDAPDHYNYFCKRLTTRGFSSTTHLQAYPFVDRASWIKDPNWLPIPVPRLTIAFSFRKIQ